jgi:hypothetical protein
MAYRARPVAEQFVGGGAAKIKQMFRDGELTPQSRLRDLPHVGQWLSDRLSRFFDGADTIEELYESVQDMWPQDLVMKLKTTLQNRRYNRCIPGAREVVGDFNWPGLNTLLSLLRVLAEGLRVNERLRGRGRWLVRPHRFAHITRASAHNMLRMPPRGKPRIDCYGRGNADCPGVINAQGRCVPRGNPRMRSGYDQYFDQIMGRRGTYEQRHHRRQPGYVVHLAPEDWDDYYDETSSSDGDSSSDE